MYERTVVWDGDGVDWGACGMWSRWIRWNSSDVGGFAGVTLLWWGGTGIDGSCESELTTGGTIVVPCKVGLLLGTDEGKELRRGSCTEVGAFVSLAESVFQRRVGRNGIFPGTAALLYPTPFGGFIYMMNLGHIWGDGYRRCM